MGDDVIVGYVGRLSQEKGLAWLFHAFSAAELPNTRLYVFGSGPDAASLRTLAAELDIPVVFFGSVSPDRVPAVMASIDALVVPSLTTPGWAEQFGRVVVEGMFARTPVISSDSGSLAEVVGEGGIIVPELDVPRLAEALTRIVSDPAERRTIGDAGLKWAQGRFSPDELSAAFARFWADILST